MSGYVFDRKIFNTIQKKVANNSVPYIIRKYYKEEIKNHIVLLVATPN